MRNHSKLFSALLLFMVFLMSVFVFLSESSSAAAAAPMDNMRDEIKQQLSNAEATLMETRISGWVKADYGETQLPELMEKAQGILAHIGEETQAEIHSDETADYRQVKIAIRIDEADYTIYLYNSSSAGKAKSQTYIIVEAVLDTDSTICESRAYTKVEDILSNYQGTPIIAATYTASIPGRMENAEMEQIARQLFINLNADITELSRDSEWISMTGYSKQIGGGLDSVNGSFNLNIALRCHSDEDKTLICLGTPVISVPY